MSAAAPRRPAGPAPLRRPHSVRRTASIEVHWPEGRHGPSMLLGRARDLFTDFEVSTPRVCAEDAFEARLSAERRIESIESCPPRSQLHRLIGARAGGGLRQALQDAVPEERRDATPLYLLLDDIAGASLVSSWAWSHWDPNWLTQVRAALSSDSNKGLKLLQGVCIGMAPGSSAFDLDHRVAPTAVPVPDVLHPEDPQGWHAFAEPQAQVKMRRARRIDVWREEHIIIDAAFQDSASAPSGERVAIHEYGLRVTADLKTLQLRSIDADPRILPHAECVSAPARLHALLGTPLPELREKVLAELRGTAGCTHLNDAMRALADVPALLKHLQSGAK